ncbi:hypothetical protein NDU88_001348 [Pleurodeles waltl]|uniref:Uncharacterized protein n=1 Tax=Pleurodeles waltl TaxID=8319 RepID=A0AAV7THC4_PLEWA|nr:hypothetical protein NDU88_001348 [Pleurodeles waltl]
MEHAMLGGDQLSMAGPAGLAVLLLQRHPTKEVSGELSLLRPDWWSDQTAASWSTGPTLGPCAGDPG